jgi:transposase-like protein
MAKREARRGRRSFTAEFKAEAVRLCKVGDRTIKQVAADLDLTGTALRDWVKRADVDAGKGPLGHAARSSTGDAKRLARREDLERALRRGGLAEVYLF